MSIVSVEHKNYEITQNHLSHCSAERNPGGTFGHWAADHDHSSQKKTDKVKPYVLKTCPVSDEKLGGDMGQPYLFTYQDREIKLCCKSCLKDFKKDPKKYLKKIEEAEKKAKK